MTTTTPLYPDVDDLLRSYRDKGVPDVPPTPAVREEEVPSPRSGRSRRFLQSVVVALPVIVLASAAWTHRSVFADGYIYLHIVQNILAGHGPVFNAGQRVEVFTSPAWTFVLAIAGLVTPFSLAWIAVILGIVLTVGGMSIAIASSMKIVRRAEPGSFVLPLGALVFVAVAPVWSLTTMGLETGLTFFWLGCCLAILVRWTSAPDSRVSRLGLMVLGFGMLIRPELTLDSMVFIVAILLIDKSERSLRSRVRIIAWAAALPFAYEIFRMGYYGALVANTATAKEASMPRLGRGIQYFADFIGPYWLVIPALVLIVGAYYPLSVALRRLSDPRRHLVALFALPIAGALNAGYIVAMGGDYVHARLLLPSFFAVCAPIAVVPVARKYLLALIVLPWALVCSVSLRSADANPWSTAPFVMVNGHGNVNPGPEALTGPNVPAWYSGPGVYVQFHGQPSSARLDGAPASELALPTIATPWIGNESYALGTHVQILDLLGLADPFTAHLELARRGEVSGHEKPLPTPWVAARLTAPGTSTAQLGRLQMDMAPRETAMIPVVTGQKLAVETAWARAALQCPAIVDLVNAPSQPLTVGTFFSNMAHSFSRTELRIPPDPETAYHQFCGPGTPAGVDAVMRAN